MRTGPGRRHAARLVAALGVATSALVLGMAPAASAGAAGACNASAADIYAPASGTISDAPGTVLACRKVTPNVLTLLPTTAYQIRYVTTDWRGTRVPATGIVLSPTVLFGGNASSRLVAYSAQTVGLGSQCAASKQLTRGGFVDDSTTTLLSGYLRDGASVVMSDGVGYVDGQTHTYVIGDNNGRAQLDAARAASRVPGLNVKRTAKVVLRGYSEGGHSTMWAAQLARSYAPELPIVGAAAGAAPMDLRATAYALNGSLYAGFLGDSVLGLHAAFPEMPFDELINATGRALIAKVSSSCLLGTLASAAFKKIESLTVGGIGLDQIFAVEGPGGVTWGDLADSQSPGWGVGPVGSGAQYEIGFPILDYWGRQDDVIPPVTQQDGAARLCAAGLKVRVKTYVGLHATADFSANGDVRDWVKARFDGKPEAGTC